MLTLTPDYIKSIPIPGTAWQEEFIQKTACYVIRNPVFCRVFWIHLWRNNILEKFKRQHVYTRLSNVDLDRTVIINSLTGELISAPVSVNSIDYFAGRAVVPDAYFENHVILTSIKPIYIVAVYILVSLVLGYLSIVMKPTSLIRRLLDPL